jgi:hypothetical protein
MKARQTAAFLLVSGLAVIAVAAPPAATTVAKAKPVTVNLQAAGSLFASDPLTCLANNAGALKSELDAWKVIPGLSFSKAPNGGMIGWCYYNNYACLNACKAGKQKIDAILQKCSFTSCGQLTVSCNEIPG